MPQGGHFLAVPSRHQALVRQPGYALGLVQSTFDSLMQFRPFSRQGFLRFGYLGLLCSHNPCHGFAVLQLPDGRFLKLPVRACA